MNKIKCSKPGCNEEGQYRTGDLKHAKVFCVKHYCERLRKQTHKGKNWEVDL